MKISLIQMDVKLGNPEVNYARAEALIRGAAKDGPDVICLPELWDVGFFPRESLGKMADPGGLRLKKWAGALAREAGCNIAAGSAAVLREEGIYNTACFFDREGTCAGEYDKVHLFTPMEEERYFQAGNRAVAFEADGVRCGIVICYDIRFPEWLRTVSLEGIDVLFVAAQWPLARKNHWKILNRARAIENQCFVVCTNACGLAGETRFAGCSAVYDPWGEPLIEADGEETVLTCEMDLAVLKGIRETIGVYRDRRPELYRVNRQWGEKEGER